MSGQRFDHERETEQNPQMSPQMAALLHAIQERRKEAPLAGAQVGAKEVFQRLLEGMKDSRGVHIESLLTALGALAGYSCQASLRARAVAQDMPETAPFQVIETRDGKRYFFGDALNHALGGSQLSVLAFAGGAAQHMGAKDFPDFEDAFQHTSSVLGSAQFGIPRLPDEHKPGDTPLNYLKAFWPVIHPTAKLFCQTPEEWPILYGMAIYDAICAGKDAIEPGMAFRIVLESVIPMSKVDLANA